MGNVYAVLFKNGLFKIGMTKNLPMRVRSHVSSGKSFGYELDVFFFTERHAFYERTEKKLLEYCRDRFQANTTEYFEGGDYHSVKEAMMRSGTLVGWGNGVSVKDDSIIISMPEGEQKKEKRTAREKILKILKRNPEGLTLGVIKNRCRPNEVHEELMSLLADGEIRSEEFSHPVNEKTITRFFLS